MSVSPDSANLHWIIKNKNKSDILELLESRKVDLNSISENGDTILHLLFQNEDFGEKDFIQLLEAVFDQGIDPNVKNNQELTVLHLAVANRWRDAVDLLLKRNAKISMCDKEGNSIAHFFMKDERRKFRELWRQQDEMSFINSEKFEQDTSNFTEWLLSKGFDFDQTNKYDKSALHLSIDFNLQHTSLVLLQHTRDINFVDEQNESLLHLLIEYTNLGRHEFYNDALRTWYSSYISRYFARIVKLLIDKGVSCMTVNLRNQTCLERAIRCGEQSVIDLLINHLVQEKDLLNAIFLTLFECCSQWDNSKTEYFLNICHDMIAKGAEVNSLDKHGKAALHYAFEAKNQSGVDFLSNHSADFSVRTTLGNNLFHELATVKPQNESQDKVQETLFDLLLSKDCCDLNATNTDEETPIHLASFVENLTIVRKLIEHGAEVNCKNRRQETPLMLLAWRYQKGENVLKLLLKSGAEVNAEDIDGRRPLYFAAVFDHKLPLVRELLKRGAYVNVYASPFQNSPFTIALQRGYLSNANEMLAYGADINDSRIPRLLMDSGDHSVKFVLEHWIKLKAADMPCLKEYETLVEGDDYQQLYQACLCEVKKLKNTFIDSYDSIYDFLRMDFGKRCIHVNNQKLREIINSPKLDERFSKYSVIILASYRETAAWKKLLEPAKKAWRELTKIDLLEECVERILAHLRIEDMVRMIENDEKL